MIRDLIIKNRSYRRFFEDKKVTKKILIELIELARFCASGGNRQPLKYFLSNNSLLNSRIFMYLSWAAYLNNWEGPVKGERPSAYIIILGDKTISNNFDCDLGIASQNILLGATEMGLGGCIIRSIKRDRIRSELNIDEKFEILLIIALGYPNENVVVEQVGSDGDIKYWRDDQGNHHVPKRPLEELIINF